MINKPMQLTYSTLALTMLMALSANAQQPLSLEQSLSYALQHSPLVTNAKIDTEIAKKKVFETTAMGLPQVSGSLGFQNFIDIPTTVIPANAFNPAANPDDMVAVQFGTDFNASAEVTANQLIFDGAYIVGLQAAKTYKELSQENLRRTEAAVKEQVSQSFYTALVMQENVNILLSSLENVTSLRREMEAIYQVGMAEEQDVDQLKLTEKSIENTVSTTRRQADLALSLLKLNIGMPLDSQVVLTGSLDQLASSFLEPAADTAFNLQGHYDYRLAVTNSELLRLNMKKEKFGYLPSLYGFITHQQNAMRNNFDFFEDKPWYPSTIWGVNLSVPLFDSGLKGARIGQARLEYEKSLNTLKFAEEQLKLQVDARRNDYMSALLRTANDQDNLRLAQSIYDKTLIKYKEGLASSLELSQAQTQYLNIQSSYMRTLLETFNASIAYNKALGF